MHGDVKLPFFGAAIQVMIPILFLLKPHDTQCWRVGFAWCSRHLDLSENRFHHGTPTSTFRSFVGARRHANFSFISSRFFSVSIFGMQWHRHLLADMLTFSYLDKNNGWHMDVKISTDKFMVVITIFYHSTLAIYWKVRYVFASLFLLLLRKANTKGQQHKNKSSQTPWPNSLRKFLIP